MNDYDGKFHKKFVQQKIQEYNFEFIENMIKSNCLNGEIEQFIANELLFIEQKIAENINYGYGIQLFQHQKKQLLEYCKLNNIPTTNQLAPIEIPFLKNEIPTYNWFETGKTYNNHSELSDYMHYEYYLKIPKHLIGISNMYSKISNIEIYKQQIRFLNEKIIEFKSNWKYPKRNDIIYFDDLCKNEIDKIELYIKEINENELELNKHIENSILTTNQLAPPQIKWQDLIKLELQDRLVEIENKIEPKISNWKQRKSLIECAGFCQLLYDKKYFVQGSTNQKSVNSFALCKYGTDITNQLKTAKKDSRDIHKQKLNKYFN
ncbi:MAG: hypothetical protein IPK18_08495 [Sphingobacteriales bacterium]|nr:MAG: hypothetical protein IPK18_08495 [Sphingobacteriales bacterium]